MLYGHVPRSSEVYSVHQVVSNETILGKGDQESAHLTDSLGNKTHPAEIYLERYEGYGDAVWLRQHSSLQMDTIVKSLTRACGDSTKFGHCLAWTHRGSPLSNQVKV